MRTSRRRGRRSCSSTPGFDEEAIAEITRVLGEGMARLAATIDRRVRGDVPAGRRQRARRRDAVRGARRAADAGGRADAASARSTSTCARASAAGSSAGPSSRPARSPTRTRSPSASPTWSASRGWAASSRRRSSARVAGRFAELAGEVVRAPVRLIKTIGDAAMFVSPEPGPLVAVALSLVEAVDEPRTSRRCGRGSRPGPALLRAGDFYGHSVNLASRVTGIARPGSVLCTEEVRDAAPDRVRLVVRRAAPAEGRRRSPSRCTARGRCAPRRPAARGYDAASRSTTKTSVALGRDRRRAARLRRRRGSAG